MLKLGRLGVLLLIGTVLFACSDNSQSENLAMFSFFGKKKKIAPTVLNPTVGTRLTQVDAFPQTSVTDVSLNLQVQKVYIEGNIPDATIVAMADNVELWNLGFAVTGNTLTKPFAFINNIKSKKIEQWTLSDNAGLQFDEQIYLPQFHPEQEKWISFSLQELAIISDEVMLFAVGYYNPRPTYTLYHYDRKKSAFSMITEVVPDTENLNHFFDKKQINADTALVLYYADTVRESAEIYHNYVNYIRLFSPAYPHGVEVVKLGIDDGNVTTWQVLDSVLFLSTIDKRGHKPPASFNWSIDLSPLLQDAAGAQRNKEPETE